MGPRTQNLVDVGRADWKGICERSEFWRTFVLFYNMQADDAALLNGSQHPWSISCAITRHRLYGCTVNNNLSNNYLATKPTHVYSTVTKSLSAAVWPQFATQVQGGPKIGTIFVSLNFIKAF